MIQTHIDGCAGFAPAQTFDNYLAKALEALETLDSGSGQGSGFTGWNLLPSQIPDSLPEECNAIGHEWRAKGIDLAVVVGIGGSYLGARATIEALSHSFAAVMPSSGIRVVFAGNNLSGDYLAELVDAMALHNVACIVISKSGTTTEPAVAFRLIKQFIEEKYGSEEAATRIVAVTDACRGALKTLSTSQGFRTFVIPDNVGGRFSVLTPVGLLPIAVAGYDVMAMVEGARQMQEQCSLRSAENPAVKYAAIRNLLYDNGRCIEVLASFNPKLQYVAEWWKQLFGESEGKQGRGIFPASVIYTTDLHSMGQYIQDGERKLFETVIKVDRSRRPLAIQSDPQDLDGLNYLAGKQVDFCNEMARKGTMQAHIDGGVPNVVISIDRIDERNLGALFYFFEKACGISAYMLGVNPFDQPGVEVYKKNMFRLLGKR